MKREKKISTSGFSELQDNLNWTDIYVIGIPRIEEREQKKSIGRYIMAVIFPNFLKTINNLTIRKWLNQ